MFGGTGVLAGTAVAVCLCALDCAAETTEPCLVESQRKPDREWQTHPTRTVAQLAGFDAGTSDGMLDRFGGLREGRTTATGFFRTQKIDGRWWLIDPDGGRFIHVGVASVRMGQSAGAQEALAAKFKSRERWACDTAQLLKENGFNGCGGWSDAEALGRAPAKLVYTMVWSFMASYGNKHGRTYAQPGHTGYPNDCIFVFDPDFETFCDSYAKQLAAYAKDPWLLGHFSDNEMPLRLEALDNYLALPRADHGHRAARDWLRSRRGQDYVTTTTVTDDEREDFLGVVVDRYFRIVSQAIRKHDPNHLFIGSRFHSVALRLPEVFRAAGPHADVMSINYYNAWTPRAALMEMWVRESGRPFIVSEFYMKAMDSGLDNSSGAGWIVRTQRDRGLFYQNFTLGLMESKGCVGWHWFRYMDNEAAEARSELPRQDSNKGIVSLRYVPYEALLALMRELNTRVYSVVRHFDR